MPYKNRNKILIIDDEEVNRVILDNNFEGKYEILEAENGQEALKLVEEHQDSIAAILLDVIMPVMDGITFLKHLDKSCLKMIPVILITGELAPQVERDGFDYGVVDVIHKPFDPELVLRRVSNAIELYHHKNNLEDIVKEQAERIREQTARISAGNEFIIDALSTVVEFRNLETGSHIRRIKKFTEVLLTYVAEYYPAYGLTSGMIEQITAASALHDIGKIAISDTVLLKPGKLTAEEFEIMKKHTIKGCEMLGMLIHFDDVEFYQYCYDICRYHHEKWQGEGYPDKLKGNAIPIWAQVVAVADIYDALVTKRVYKDAYSHEKAVNMIKAGECGSFNQDILDCFEYARNDFLEIARIYD